MGKFDGILIASDWDGTLAKNGVIPKANIDAIRYFQDNGGIFTVSSGRYSQYLKQFKNLININTYTICYNGAYIADIDTGEVLYEGFCDEYLFDILTNLLSLNLNYKTIALYDNINPEPIEYTVEDFKNHIDEHRQKKLYKVLLRSDTPEHAEEGVNAVNKLDLKDYIAVRSWEISLEIMKRENAKGEALKRVAKATNARLTIGVGDYENDIQLLESADIGYAVEGSISALLPYADRITVSQESGAIAKIIEDLEKEIK